MKLKYSKFDFDSMDIFQGLFFFFISDKGGIIFIGYLIYRIYIVYLLKKKMNIEFHKTKISIRNKFMRKEIYYDDIKIIYLRKNVISSYDLLINFDEGLSTFKYICNYLSDSFSIGGNKNKAFIFCDLKNAEEVVNEILLNFNFNQQLTEKDMELIAKFPYDSRYTMSKIKNIQNKILLKISSETVLYCINDFIENEKTIEVNYGIRDFKSNLYCYYYRLMPLKYEKMTAIS